MEISIHAPHARSDQTCLIECVASCDFNPRPSCEERPLPSDDTSYPYISIHAPHARSDSDTGAVDLVQPISIHAPHARSDNYPLTAKRAPYHFNPHPSCEERHCPQCGRCMMFDISIHTPHARSDRISRPFHPSAHHFNPHPSCEERLQIIQILSDIRYFNPHPSCEERLQRPCRTRSIRSFQSTLPMRGATPVTAIQILLTIFQSTLPMRGATFATA